MSCFLLPVYALLDGAGRVVLSVGVVVGVALVWWFGMRPVEHVEIRGAMYRMSRAGRVVEEADLSAVTSIESTFEARIGTMVRLLSGDVVVLALECERRNREVRHAVGVRLRELHPDHVYRDLRASRLLGLT